MELVKVVDGTSDDSCSLHYPPTKNGLRVFVVKGDERITLDIEDKWTVYDVKEAVRHLLGLGADEGPTGVQVQEKKILTLNYAGSELDDSWPFADIGIGEASTIKALLREEVKPSLYVYSAFNDDTVALFDQFDFTVMTLADFRSRISRKIGVFRLLNEQGVEMYDCHTLYDYGVQIASTVRLDIWDGWNDLLNVSIMGFSSQVISSLSKDDDSLSRFQMKVALYIAAHMGHVDLAVVLLRVRADEPTGLHPSRLWCRNSTLHLDSLKTPIHEATESGQLGVLRTFVNNNVSSVLARDGNGLMPLNIALRLKKRSCASFLLTKQWSKVSFSRKSSIPLTIYARMKKWGDQSRDKVLRLLGQCKSSTKHSRRPGCSGALLRSKRLDLFSLGLVLDGYTPSKLTSRVMPSPSVNIQVLQSGRTSVADTLGKRQQSIMLHASIKLPRLSRFGRMASRIGINSQERLDVSSEPDSSENGGQSTGSSPENILANSAALMTRSKRSSAAGLSQSTDSVNGPRLPPIREKKLQRMSSTPLTDVAEFDKNNKSFVLRTGGQTDSSSPMKYSSSPSIADSTPSLPKQKKSKQKQPRSTIPMAKNRNSSSTGQTGSGALPSKPLPGCGLPRPFVSGNTMSCTMLAYEQFRGLHSRDYAIKCLLVANRFREKPWLTQVQQAMIIANRGVKRIIDREPHLFSKRQDEQITPLTITDLAIESPIDISPVKSTALSSVTKLIV